MEPAGRVALRAASGDLIARVRTAFTAFHMISFTSDGRFLALGGPDGRIMLVDAGTGAPVLRFDGTGDRIIAAETRGDRLFTGDHGGDLTLQPLFLDPGSAIAEAGELVSRLKPLSPADRCRFFLDPAETCVGAAER